MSGFDHKAYFRPWPRLVPVEPGVDADVVDDRPVAPITTTPERPSIIGPQYDRNDRNDQSPRWPVEPDRAAFAGLPGRVVDMIDPHTEADRVAVLATFLAAFGSAIGSGPHALVGADRHGCNVFLALVGRSAKARKGASWTPVRALFDRAMPDWAQGRIVSGLGSGEGLVYAVRDAIYHSEAVKDKGKRTGEYEEVQVDPGEPDKRALVMATELASVLRVMSRQGSTLSAVLRDAWDRGDLRVTTKNAPIRATGAHVSVLAHVTEEELRRELTDTETVNGFGNRFLWLGVRRSKHLPEPAPFVGVEVERLAEELETTIGWASVQGRLQRDGEARELWAANYQELSRDGFGLAGALTDRGEPQVLRLSLLYALSDGSATVRAAHLESALALWRYVERSVEYLFGKATGDPVADAIENAVRKAGSLDRTAIRDLFGRNESSARIDHALGVLAAAGRLQGRKVTSDGRSGRPPEVWQVTT